MKCTGKYKEMAEQFRKDGADEYMVEKLSGKKWNGMNFERVRALPSWKPIRYGSGGRKNVGRCIFITLSVGIVEARPSLQMDTISGRITGG